MALRTPRSQRGFSLIELLVVIAIIAVLAALLLPTIGAVKDLAERSRCASQMRQVVMASVAYRGDNQGLYPLVYWKDTSWTTWSSWAYQPWQGRWQHFLYDYTESYAVFNCPVAVRLDPVSAVQDNPISGYQKGTAIGGGPGGWCTALTAYNSQCYGRGEAWTWTIGTTPNYALPGPMDDRKVDLYLAKRAGANRDHCPMFMDGVWQNDLAYYNNPYAARGKASFPHRMRANMAWPDGHTQVKAFTEVTSWDPMQVSD